MPEPHPKEFRDDVVAVPARVARRPIADIAKDFGISESCLRNWLAKADVEDGRRPGVAAARAAELRELKRRNRLLEQENEVLRRAAAYLSQANLRGQLMYPLVRELAVDGISVTVTCQVLLLARQPYYRWLVKPDRRPRPRAGVPGQRRDRRPPRRSGARLPTAGRRGAMPARPCATRRCGGSPRPTGGGFSYCDPRSECTMQPTSAAPPPARGSPKSGNCC